MTRDFFAEVEKNAKQKNSAVCVGLDPVPERIHDMSVGEFVRTVVDATKHVAVCYKPNAAFYEALDDWDALLDTMEYARKEAPVLVDAKRGDVGHTSERYARILDEGKADAITVNPYLGKDALEPFMGRSSKGIFVLCKTSNPGSDDFQNVDCGSQKLYARVAEKVVEWDENSNLGLVVGATHPEEMRDIRDIAGNLPFLIPGVGAQGGGLEAAVEYGLDSGRPGIINSTRSIIYADEENPYEGAKKAAEELRDAINSVRES